MSQELNLEIVSNYHPRPLLSIGEIPVKELIRHEIPADSEDSFFRYRGQLYCLSDFMRSEGAFWKAGWHAHLCDSAFSAILIRLSPDGDEVVVGLALS